MSPSMSPIAGVRSTSRGGASEPNTGAPGWTFGYSWVRTGWPPLKLWSGEPSAFSTCSSPLESANTMSSLLSPFRSYSRSDASPPVPNAFDQPACSVVSR